MTRRDAAPRDLLFGLLALQNGMVTRDQLVAAFAVGTASGRPMAELLVEEGALSPHRREVLDALAEEHLALHGGDPEASLAAIESLSTVGGTTVAAVGPGGDPQGVAPAQPDLSRWRRACGVFFDVVRHDPSDRAAHLERACAGDDPLRADVQRLLAVDAGARDGGLLDGADTAGPTGDHGLGETITIGPAASAGVRPGGSHRFRLLRPYARGGLGAVYIALDIELNREVALKQIVDDLANSPEYCDRFLREAEITGRLEHPAIVPVYSFGRLADEKPYYAMRLIRGITMARAITEFHSDPGIQGDPRRRALELRKLLGRFLTVCDAVAYAHGRGVLHRDLKPSNVMLGDYGETLVVDWGLAKATGYRDPVARAGEATLRPRSGPDSTETQAGTRLGTPGFMSPEQAAGKLDDLGPASDVYSLGATLYVLLTGRPPHTERDVPALLSRLERGDVVPPRRIKAWIDPALEAICLKAMAASPADRYSSARALAEELQNWLADEPVSAWREPLSRRAGRWAKRHRTSVAVALMLMVFCPTAGLYLLYESRLRRAQRQTAAEGRVEALLTSEVQEMPRMVAELSADLAMVRARLESHAAEGRPVRHRLASSLALLPAEPGRAGFLVDRAVDPSATPDEVRVIGAALLAHGPRDGEIVRRLAGLVANPEGNADVRLRAAGVLAQLAPEDPCWRQHAGAVARILARESPLRIDAWGRIFQSVAPHLSAPLLELLAHHEESEAADRAFAVLLAWARMPGDPRGAELLAALMAESEPSLLPELIASMDGAGERVRVAEALKSRIRVVAGGDPARDRRQGRVAAALMRLGEFDAIWPLLRQVPDSGARAEVIEHFAVNGADPGRLIDRLFAEGDASVRRALVLALGNYPRRAMPAGRLPALEQALLRWYREDPDAGLHGALGWLLREGWGMGLSLDRIGKELAGDSIPDDRGWFVSRSGRCFTVLRGPITFRAGSRGPAEPGGPPDVQPFDVRIPRSYAIAATEVTMGDYLLYLDERPERRQEVRSFPKFAQIFADRDCAAGLVTWFDAADYCNWLSRREGIPEAQWCYPRRCAPGMELPADHLERTGYRLPTEAEWEYACKAGSVLARRHFGESDALLGAYARFVGNTGEFMPRVGGRKPNDFGLFDMLGNAYEWCLGIRQGPPPSPGGSPIEDRMESRSITEAMTEPLRGGAANNAAAAIGSARRVELRPSSFFSVMGFRVARTCPPGR